MTDENPAVRPLPWSALLRCIVGAFSVSCFLWLVSMIAPLGARAQGTTATVTGAARVLVRRGPGKQFPPLASVTRGSTVEVQDPQGEWARVSTPAGQVGYV